MKSRLFIDTGAFYAKYVARDAHHEKALALWGQIKEKGMRCVTTNFVLAELVSLLVYRFGAKASLIAAREIYASSAIQIIPITLEIEMKALEWLERFSDQKFSMADATSFAIMEQEKITTAFSFDADFTIAKFELFH